MLATRSFRLRTGLLLVRNVVILAAAAGVAAALAATPASAMVIRLHAHLYGAFPSHNGAASLARFGLRPRVVSGHGGASPVSGSPPLLYQGGPIVGSMTTRVIYWAPSGFGFPSGFGAGLDGFLNDLATAAGASSNVTGIALQYRDAEGGALSQGLMNATSASDGNSYPSSGCATDNSHPVCLTDQQISNELSHFVSSLGWSTGTSYSYVLVTPPGVRVCFDSSSGECSATAFCGYHSDFFPAGTETPYTVLPYPELNGCATGGGPHDPSLDAAITIEAHELMETATDPQPGSGYVDASGEEIGDICAWEYGATATAANGGAFNQTINRDQYLLQEMWSNIGSSCDQTFSSSLGTGITSSPTVEAGGTADYSAGLQNDPAPLSSIQWSYSLNGGSPVQFGTSASASTVLTGAGTYAVWATMIDTTGNTLTATATTTVVSPPTASFAWQTVTGGHATQAGQVISFNGSSSAADHAQIASWQWDYGDGNTGVGEQATHAYASAGIYTVTLAVTDTNGFTGTTTQTISVSAPPSSGGGSGGGGAPRGGSTGGGTGFHSGSGGSSSNSGYSNSGSTRSRTLRVSAGHRHRGYWLEVRGSGYTGRWITITIGWLRQHHHSYRVRIDRRGRFDELFYPSYAPLRLLSVR